MSQKSKLYKAINREYEQVRSQYAAALRMRRETVYSRVPRIKAIEEEMSLLGIRISGLALREPERVEELAEKLKVDMQKLREEKEMLLTAHGFSKQTLALEYACEQCKDTGYIGTRQCGCMKQKLMNAAYDQSNVRQMILAENFDTFDIRCYSDEIDQRIGQSPRENIRKILRVCLNLTKNFGHEFNNLLLYGGTGLGKTFLCNCIAKELLDKGYTVLYLTAGQLFKVIENNRFGKEDEEEKEDYLEDILDVDLLIIDDLGTEFTTILSTSELFHIVNARLLQKKPVVISTNLAPNNLIDLYSDRLVSRLLGEYDVLELVGTDIRLKKKYR